MDLLNPGLRTALDQTATAAAAAVRDLVRLAVPLGCAGCGEPDVVVCGRCLGGLGAGAYRADGDAPRLARLPEVEAGTLPRHGVRPGTAGGIGGADGLVSRWPVLAGVEYLGVVRSLVGSWKDRGRTDCTPVVTGRFHQIALAGRAVVDEHLCAGYEVWVVPAPSTPSAVRRRGREPTTELARAAVGAFVGAAGRGSSREPVSSGEPGGGAGRPPRVRLVRALVHRRRRTLDQAGLGARARGGNLSGALRVRRRHRAPGRTDGTTTPVVCILVDDVLTTGATLAECERALGATGRTVVLGLVLTAAPSPGTTDTPSSQGPVVHSGLGSG